MSALPASPRAAGGRGERWPATALRVGLLLAVYACWQLFRWPAGDRALIGDVLFYPVDVVAMLAALAAARRCATRPRLRAGWRLLALAALSYLLADVAQTFYEAFGATSHPSVADAFYLLAYPLMLLGVLRFPPRRASTQERVGLGLDLAMVAIGGFVIVMCIVLGPRIRLGGSDSWRVALSIAYPVCDMVLLVGVGSALLRGVAPSSVRALQFLAVGLICFVVADLAYGYISIHSSYHGGDPVDSLWMVALALMAIAASAQRVPDALGEGVREHPRAQARWLPFTLLALVFGVLLFEERADPLLPGGSIVISATMLTALVSLRQLLSQRDLNQTQGQLSYQAMHDALTGLPNRSLVVDRAEQMLSRARRARTPVAALCIGLDGFKQINDGLGHDAGDELLGIVAERLTEVVREADTVGRPGSDEFIVLLDDYTFDAQPELVAERICEVLNQPASLRGFEDRPLRVTVSIGIATGDRSSAEMLLRDAGLAMYEAKAAGRDRWVTFGPQLAAVSQSRLELEMDLREALEKEQLFLQYQPTFDLESQAIVAVEALVRWRHPRRGVVPPDQFIPLAEDTGLIVPIGRWVLQTACAKARAWQRLQPTLGVLVNVSARQLEHAELLSDIEATLRATGIDASTLTLEITETALMRDPDAAAERLARLKALGLRLAVDDFGTGYSSLSYLRRFPVDVLKIDRSFVSSIGASPEDNALVHTLVQLGKALGLETIGEGIEHEGQLRQLQHERCDSGQGFLLARPLDPEAVGRLLRFELAARAAAPRV